MVDSNGRSAYLLVVDSLRLDQLSDLNILLIDELFVEMDLSL